MIGRKILMFCYAFFYSIKEFIKLRKIQIPLKEFVKLKRFNLIQDTILFNTPIKIADSFWYLFSLKEIFIDEVYKFKSKNEKPYILDCGSNIGLSSIYFKRLYPEAQIVGFEPDRQNFSLLKFNLSQFNYNDITIYQKAIWVENRELYFERSSSIGGHITDEERKNVEKIESLRLKDFLDRKIDFLKIDIEGFEYDVIFDCKDKLINVGNIFIEYHSNQNNPQMLGEMVIILKNAGFRVYLKEAWENMKHPFIDKKVPHFDLQLNIFGYRR
jgi:FkbM family methyltransferase